MDPNLSVPGLTLFEGQCRVKAWRVSVVVECLACSTPTARVQVVVSNDANGTCPRCGAEFVLGGITWHRNADGEIRVGVVEQPKTPGLVLQ